MSESVHHLDVVLLAAVDDPHPHVVVVVATILLAKTAAVTETVTTIAETAATGIDPAAPMTGKNYTSIAYN